MNWGQLGTGLSMFALGLVILVGTRWAMRHGTRPVQQVALVAPLTVGTIALIGGVGLLMTAATIQWKPAPMTSWCAGRHLGLPQSG